jgi:hypothetical protein
VADGFGESQSPVAPSAAQPELVPKPEAQPRQPGAVPPEPALGPSDEAQAPAQMGSVPTTLNGALSASNGDAWTAADKGGYHELGANPPAATDDRSASGWQGIQR